MTGLRIHRSLVIPEAELHEQFARSDGPGGQNVNKVASKAILRWRPADSTALSEVDRRWLLDTLHGRLTRAGYLLLSSTATRDQSKNRQDVRQRMAALIRQALVRPRRRVSTRPSRSSVEKRITNKKQRSDTKRQRRYRDDS